MSHRAPDAGRVSAADVKSENMLSLVATQQTSRPLPFSSADAELCFDLASAWEFDHSPTRARRIRELGRRFCRMISGAGGAVTLCDAADLFHSSRHSRLSEKCDRERAQLLAWRIMRALDYSVPRQARFEVTASGMDALTDGTADVADDADQFELEALHAAPTAAAADACTRARRPYGVTLLEREG